MNDIKEVGNKYGFKQSKKWGSKRRASVVYCENCEDTSFESMVDDKCIRCGKQIKKRDAK